jgi:hypothetical protein
MQNGSDSQQPMQAWWKRDAKESLSERINAVQNVNDPTIISDNIQRGSKWAAYVLLLFTTFLSAFSYSKFFSHSFGMVAIPMAIVLACVIEFGKNWGFLTMLRIPFFQGWSFVWHKVSNSVMWIGLLLLALVTFSASVYNSTRGAEQLSLLLGHERNKTTFLPNTADIDAQLASTEARIKENRATKWKGTTTVDAMRAIKTDTRTLEALQKQRSEAISAQRSDFEREASIQDEQNQYTAGNLMAVGGWVEALQIILMLMRVSAERSLDQTADRRSSEAKLRNFMRTPNGSTSHYPTNEGRSFFFNRTADGNVRSAHEKTVSQSPLTVTQQNGESVTDYADDTLGFAEKKIRSWIPSFDRKDAKNATVAANIHQILNDTAGKIRKKGFQPSKKVLLKFSEYIIDVVFPRLHEVGYRYEFEKQFVADLKKTQESATAA